MAEKVSICLGIGKKMTSDMLWRQEIQTDNLKMVVGWDELARADCND
jgi:hypothetical protein